MGNAALEKAMQTRLVKKLRARGAEVMKTAGSPMSVGQPDLIACWLGLFIAIECKRVGEKPTPLQVSTLAKWAKAGAITLIAYDDEAALKYIDDEIKRRSQLDT